MNLETRNHLWEVAHTLRDAPREERISVCAGAAATLAERLEDLGVTGEAFVSFTLFLVRLGVSADRALDQEEYDLWHEVFNLPLSPEEFYAATNGGADPEFIASMDALIDSFDSETKTAACVVVMSFIVADGEVTPEEFELLVKLFD